MKKKRDSGFPLRENWQKILLVMKLKLFFILIACCQVTAAVHSQNKLLDMHLKNVSLEQVIWELEGKTDFTFMYWTSEIKDVKVSVDMKQKSIDDILSFCLRNTGLIYEINGDAIVIHRLKDEEPRKLNLVKGVVKDEKGEPLPGVTVMEKGTKSGVVTNGKGEFTYSTFKDTVTFVVSFIGMKTRTVTWEGQKLLTVILEENAQEVEEVVVTGYQTVKKRTMAGSVSHVKAEDLVLTGTQTLEQALQGKIPGMMVINRSGLTGTRQRVRVRGTSTLLGSAEPVWVVDGIIQEDPLPFETNDLTNLNPDNMDMIKDFVGGAISWLNPNDIEDITVLKDAASTAIYGVKAANGVIVIKTKKGKEGRMALNYNSSVTFTPRLNYNRMELMNSKERVAVSREAYESGALLGSQQEMGYLGLALAFERGEITIDEFSKEVRELETNNTDWFDILFRNAVSHSHNISVSGGSNKSTYRASFGFNDTRNTAKGNNQRQYTGSLNMSTNLWGCVSLSFGLSGSTAETSSFVGKDPFTYASTTNRAIRAYDEKGDPYFYRIANGYEFNVMNELHNSGNTNTQSSLNANMNARWNIGKGLYYNMTFSYNYSSTHGETYYSEQTNYIANIRGYDFEAYAEGTEKYNESPLPVGGERSELRNSNQGWGWRNQLEYTKVFNEVHSFTAMLGQEIRSSSSSGYNMTSYGYLPDKGKIFVDIPEKTIIGGQEWVNPYLKRVPTLTDTKTNNLSFYTALSYMYDNRYAVNLSVRSDASNQFGQDKSTRFLPVWAAGLRWNVGSEHWLEGQDLLSDMNIRFTYGFQGNVASGVSPDLIATITKKAAANGGGYALRVDKLPAPKLKWEKVQSINIGTDFALFKNHILGSFEWYSKKTSDMVVNQDVPMENGVLSRPINGGKMKNSGWDASISFTPLRTKDMVLSLGFNFGMVNNEVNSTLEPKGNWREAASGNLNKEGYAVSSFWAYRFKGLNPEHGGPEFDLSGIERQGAESDATMYMEYAGKLDPDFTTGISFTFRYKTLSLSSGLYFSMGNQQFLAPMGSVYESIPGEEYNMSTEWLKRWRKPGDEKITNVPSLPNRVTSAQEIPVNLGNVRNLKPYELYAFSSIRVVDAWYIRCNSIQLSYTVPTEKLPSFLQNLSCSFSLSNPFQIRSKDFLGRDPEVALGNQPMSHDYAFSLSVSF